MSSGSVFQRMGAVARALADALSGRTARLALAQAEADARRAEARLREALDVLPEGIVFLDPEGRYILWNKRYAEMYHRSADLFREGAKLADTLRIGVLRGDYPQAVGQEEAWLAARLSALDQATKAHEQQLADGRWIRIEERRTADGGNIGLRVDITDLKRQSEALEAALQRAEMANRAKSEFLAKVSHELRTPLNGVMGMADALGRSLLTADQSEVLDSIRVSGRRLSSLIDDLLDFNTLDAGQNALKAEPFGIAGVVREAATGHAEAARAKGVALTIEIAEAAEDQVLGDSGRVGQIVDNLVANAVKFTEEGHVDVALDAHLTEGGKCFRITVRDTGPGFPPQEAERLFDSFEQADDSSTTRHSGLGLGLAICLKLTERMNGRIRAEGEPGKGAVFTVELPLPAAPEAPAEDESRALKVLLAEDNPTNRRVIELMLGSMGVQVTSVENGALAVEAVRCGDFDVILMDLRMPVMDGLTAIRTIRAEEAADEGRRRAPVVVLSANTSAQDQRESAKAGADAHLGKPIQVESLLQTLHDVAS